METRPLPWALSIIVSTLLGLGAAGCPSESERPDASCRPSCEGRSCGLDGCGGSCGNCPSDQTCSAAGQCEPICVADCTNRNCGDDGCGGSCGTCLDVNEVCVEGRCCLPNCTGRDCGADGCGGSCGDCPPNQTPPILCEETTGQCVTCMPQCTGRECGDDGCSGECAPGCGVNEICNSMGRCESCTPDCTNRQCGSDGCNGECPPGCNMGETCDEQGQCQACVGDCTGRRCGDDGCGMPCGTCPSNSSMSLTCTDFGVCKCDESCASDCADKACGHDGCGGDCGGCNAGSVCAYDRTRSPAWQCDTFPSASTMMSFFVTSTGNGASGGNFGGLAGADQKCRQLAEAAGVTGKTWRAYLSVSGQPARDRIGAGPWFNARGVRIVAAGCTASGSLSCLNDLHNNGFRAELALTEKGEQVDWANAHDIFTGSSSDGQPTGTDCSGWTSNAEAAQGTVGHSNSGRAGASGDSWNSSHGSGCDEVGHQCTAGQGHLYCFAQ